MKWILTLCLCIFAPFSMATADTKDDKYEGIEITVNVNTASAEEIASLLKGIGDSKAQSIVDYRNEHGPFEAISDLTNVKGIGAATIEKNQGRILL
ncbi:ComEA family DNA-binding protein [Vibrio mytili]|uniref:Transporter n=1 Tax=Vibrio mytili TaxID=50718 RepID=A0A0C3HVN5_9VIBR|nr:ComEA family DNA-binding protein [Vibrio mytili]KIN12301.1 transporter [Vibrio mytili]